MKFANTALLAFLTSTMGVLGGAAIARTETGIVALKSAHNVEETTQRLQTLIQERGFKLVAQVDHAAAANSVGLSLRPTRLLIFGNPKAGTLLMQCSQSVAIDLPLKALIWADEAGQVWLGYTDPNYLQQRHGLAGCEQSLTAMGKALGALAQGATQP
jgi:uncharacterized protein (DUF302 family)